jgi:hypothetical protein
MAGELLHLAAMNDRNGNANRIFILIRDGAIVDGEAEDCAGKPERFRDFLAVRINVSGKELKSWRQQLAAVIAWQTKTEALAGMNR